MVIEKVHGLQATSMSLNDRFTMLGSAPPPRPRMPRRRPSVGSLFNQNIKLNQNQDLIEQLARRLEQQARRQSLRQRLGVGPGALRRFGSESSLPGRLRSNSIGSLNQRGIKSRISWRQSHGNLSRAASFGNLSQGTWRGRTLRGFRRRGANRALRGRLRGGVNFGRVNRASNAAARGRSAGKTARGAARGRGRGRGGVVRNQAPKPVPTKEELDHQLDLYMAGTKSALDAELDTYMKNAMDTE
ncbi:hypothetical protein MSG28_011664 [Choristoneura fumiferana]|uniref:Uncharacterized protein n=1 Tax=Choristoneura fumiferana TaxID=7141 RepID=A0ACC0KM45_CHOFU|nr:hypothetical protein MSG28_011664 [Choristoneura fumiferana]